MFRCYRKFLPVFTLFVMQNVVTLAVNLTDNIMLGMYNEAALSGVSAVNQIQFIFQQMITAMGDGVVMFGSQYWGKRLKEPIKNIASVGMKTGILLAFLLFLLTSMFPYTILKIFTTDTNIITEGVAYLQIIRFSYIIFAIIIILLASLRSVEVVKIGFLLSVVTLCINFVLNYLLIYGTFGFPELGVRGAAMATLIARVIELTILVGYIKKNNQRLELKINDFISYNRTLAADYYKKMVPMLTIALMWGVSTALQTVIFGHMSATAIAANSIASVVFLLVKGGAVGASSAATVLIGKYIGMGDMQKVSQYSKSLQKFFVLLGIAGGILLFIIRIPIINLYNVSYATEKLANQFLIVLSVVYVGMAYQMPVNDGLIRGGGNAEFVVKLNLVSIWLIVLPVSFFMAFIIKASPIVVLACLNADQIFKCVPAFIKVNWGNWVKVLTRDNYDSF